MTRSVDAWSRTAGFTLIEMLIALVLMSVAALGAVALAPPASSKPQVEADATRILAALRITRAAAMAQSHEVTFIVDPVRRTYGSRVVGTAVLASRSEVRAFVTRSDRIRSSALIRFFPSGRSSGGRIELRLGGSTIRILVDWVTGYATLE